MGVVPMPAAAQVWRENWLESGPIELPLSAYASSPPDISSPPNIRLGKDGSLLFVLPDQLRLIRVDADGALRWTRDIVSAEGISFVDIDADGTALLADSGRLLGRFAADGTPLWLRSVSFHGAARLSPDQVATARCELPGLGVVQVLDVVSGDAVWERTVPTGAAYCTGARILADGGGSAHVVFDINDGLTGQRSRIAQVLPDATLRWIATAAPGVKLVGASPDRVYIRDSYALQALTADAGQKAWQINFPGPSFLIPGASPELPAEPLILTSGPSLRRLSGKDGSPRWNVDLPADAQVSLLQTTAHLILMSVYVNGKGELWRLNPVDGGVVWTAPIPESTPGKSYMWTSSSALGPLGTDKIAIAGRVVDGWDLGEAHIALFDAASGMALSVFPAPLVPRSVTAATTLDDAKRIVGVTFPLSNSAPLVRLRRLDGLAGSPDLDIAEAIGLLPGYLYFYASPQIAAGQGSIATAIPFHAQGSDFEGASRIALYDSATGVRRWAAMPHAHLQQANSAPSTPIFDSAGNVFVSVGSKIYCTPYPYTTGCGDLSLYKLAAADGALLWRNSRMLSEVPYYESQPSPPLFTLINDDAVLAEDAKSAAEGLAVTRLSGTDGAVVWNVSIPGVPYVAGVEAVSDGNLYVHGRGNSVGGISYVLTKLDFATGAILWSTAYFPTECVPYCQELASLKLPNDDVVVAGEVRGTRMPWLLRFRGDGSGASSWAPIAGLPPYRARLLDLIYDPVHGLRAISTHYVRGTGHGLHALFSVDPDHGILGDVQVLNGISADPLADVLYFDSPAVSSNDSLIVTTDGNVNGSPYTRGAALFDTTVAAHGDLAVSVTAPARVFPGEITPFRIVADFSGTSPVDDVKLLATMPWPQGILDHTCTTQAATNCTIDDTSGNLKVRFDAAPGAHVEVAGHMRAMQADESTPIAIAATVFGPTSLAEPDIGNNLARALIATSLFVAGFED